VAEYRFKFTYSGGVADKNRLDLYDGSVSLEGIARALTITTHAFINGEVRTRGDAANGASFYMNPSRPGSFVFEVVVWMAGAASSGLFYDFVSHSFKEAVGWSDESTRPRRALSERIEPTMGELPAVLESPLKDVHRPIMRNPEMTLRVGRPRGEELITFDTYTGNALQPSIVNLSDPVVGHVTRYNTISRWGRFFDRSSRRVVSFFLEAGVSERERSLITWSLHEANLNRDGSLYLYATAVTTSSGIIKRYNVSSVSDRPLP
jgi:hypothetical protein